MFLILLANNGETKTSSQIETNPDDFLKEYGPESAHRIAITRDADGDLKIIFANEGGTVRDGATEIVQASMLVSEGGKQSLLITMQTPTDALKAITDDEQSLIGEFFSGVYFSGSRKDFVLVAKSDAELDGNTTTTYLANKGDGFKAKDVGDGDYVRIGNDMLVYADGKIATIDTGKLDENFEKNGVDGIMLGAKKITAIGLKKKRLKLARGPNIQIGDSSIETVAYVETDPDGKTKMIVIDRDTHDELKVQAFDAGYATADHGGNVVYLLSTLAGGQDIDDIVTVTPRPTDEFMAVKTATDEPGFPTP